MICVGLLMGSGTFRERLVQRDAEMPGDASDEWQLAAAIAADEPLRQAFADLKSGWEETKAGLSPDARLMRAFVRSEVNRRLRRVAYLCCEFQKFLPQEAADKRIVRGELEDLLAKLQED
jgi:hypothetical protein